MTTIQLSRLLPAPPEKVYDYVSRPARWCEWHPASLGTPGHGDASLAAGATFEEDIRAAGFSRRLRWRVVDSRPGARWEAHAVMNDGSSVRLLYELAAATGGTQFTRTLDYAVKPVVLRLLNDAVMWRRVRAESGRALDNLARKLSAAP